MLGIILRNKMHATIFDAAMRNANRDDNIMAPIRHRSTWSRFLHDEHNLSNKHPHRTINIDGSPNLNREGKTRNTDSYHHLINIRHFICRPRSLIYRSFLIIFFFFVIISLLDLLFHQYGFSKPSLKKYSTQNEYAVVINTYDRPFQLLNQTINHYKSCSSISQVFIIWGNTNKKPPLFQHPITVIQSPTSSLNYRFYLPSNLSSEALFTVDDDVLVDCQSLEHGFNAWRYNKESLVGYYPRVHVDKGGGLIYHTWDYVYFTNTFSIILTKASFMHRKYFEYYWDLNDETQALVRNYVDSKRNCEDIAMALLITSKSSSLPIFVEGNVIDKGLFGGISTSSSQSSPHFTTRSNCLTDLREIYSAQGVSLDLPIVRLSERGWKGHFPGFWWQSRPSNLFEWFPSKDLFL